jgi:hypothetical protein
MKKIVLIFGIIVALMSFLKIFSEKRRTRFSNSSYPEYGGIYSI